MNAGSFRSLVAVLCMAVLLLGDMSCKSTPQQQSQQPAGSPQPSPTANAQQAADDQPAAKIPADQLDSLVAPIAMYPDPLLSQVLVASTYPLELIQLQQWLEKNKDLKDQALVNAVSKQPWDPSIQAMAPLPEVVKRLADDLQWTTDLGNAFLAQQADVMDAIQRMRQKAQGTGALKSNEQVKVETRLVENKTVIIIEQATPEVVYVPSYDPVYVYGAPVYPYPAIYYPTYPTGTVVAATAIAFGVGVAMGAAWGGGWGWGCGWGDNDIDVNVNNNFNRNTNINNISRNNVGSGNKWQHNPRHRGGTPYPSRSTADRFGGTARGDSLANRQRAAGRELDRQGRDIGSGNRGPGSDRDGIGGRDGVGDRSNAGNRGGANRGSNAVGDRASSRGGERASDRSRSAGNRGAGASGDRVGNRNVGSGNRSGFGGDGSRYNGGSARESSSRGASSMGGSRGGGGGGAGRGGGGGGRGGGGGGRGGGGGGRRR